MGHVANTFLHLRAMEPRYYQVVLWLVLLQLHGKSVVHGENREVCRSSVNVPRSIRSATVEINVSKTISVAA